MNYNAEKQSNETKWPVNEFSSRPEMSYDCVLLCLPVSQWWSLELDMHWQAKSHEIGD